MHSKRQNARFPIVVWKVSSLYLADWRSGTRTAFLLLLSILLCLSQALLIKRTLIRNEWTVSAFECFYLLLSQGFNVLLSTMLFLVLVGDLPRKSMIEIYILARIDKRDWLMGQLLYIGRLVLSLLLLLAGFGILPLIPHISGLNVWSDIARNMPEEIALVPRFFREHSTPIAATAMAIAPLVLFWYTLANFRLWAGLYSRGSLMLSVSFIFLIGGYFFDTQTIEEISWFLPTRFSSLNALSILRESDMEYYLVVIVTYVVINLVICSLENKRANRLRNIL